MENQNRRGFLQTTVAAIGSGWVPSAHSRGEPLPSIIAANAIHAPEVAANQGKKPLRLGLIIAIGTNPDTEMSKVHELGLSTAQIFVDDFHVGLDDRLRKALDTYQIEPTSVVVGGPGKEVWDFYGGPITIGVVPRETRAARVAHIKRASDFAKECGIPAVQTHCGFIPENPNDPLYKETVETIRDIAEYCKRNGQNLRYETGQETPITLVRAIQDVGTDNQGVNFDLANLILYGKANPTDAIELLGPYIQGIHAKDGLWPTDPKKLGEEVPIGKGKVDFARMIARLKEINYRGAVTIEREISGPQQVEDIRAAKTYLANLIGA